VPLQGIRQEDLQRVVRRDQTQHASGNVGDLECEQSVLGHHARHFHRAHRRVDRARVTPHGAAKRLIGRGEQQIAQGDPAHETLVTGIVHDVDVIHEIRLFQLAPNGFDRLGGGLVLQQHFTSPALKLPGGERRALHLRTVRVHCGHVPHGHEAVALPAADDQPPQRWVPRFFQADDDIAQRAEPFASSATDRPSDQLGDEPGAPPRHRCKAGLGTLGSNR